MPVNNIIFFGHHKCGSRFFRYSVLAPLVQAHGYKMYGYAIQTPPFHYRTLTDLDLFNIDWSLLQQEHPKLINLTNAGPPVIRAIEAMEAPFIGVHVIRDPRQVWVSNYFHHLDGHDTVSRAGWVWDQLVEDRPRMQQLNQEEGLLYELDHITREVLEDQMFVWQPRAGVMEMKLEEVTPDRLMEMARFLGFDTVPPLALGKTYANPNSQDWRNVLSPALKAEFKRRYGDELIRLGYERDQHW